MSSHDIIDVDSSDEEDPSTKMDTAATYSDLSEPLDDSDDDPAFVCPTDDDSDFESSPVKKSGRGSPCKNC